MSSVAILELLELTLRLAMAHQIAVGKFAADVEASGGTLTPRQRAQYRADADAAITALEQ
jgi:hypothetical protein